MNSVFYALLFFTFLCFPLHSSGQIVESGSSEIWGLPERYYPPLSEERIFELDIFEPYGLSNIISLHAGLSVWQAQTLKRIRYSFQAIPGYRKHSIFGEFAMELANNVLVSQGLGFGFLESWNVHPPSFLIFSHNVILYSLSDLQNLFFSLDNWMSLFWPDSPHLPNCKASLTFVQNISEQVDVRAAFRFLSGSKSKILAAISYKVNDNHELFLSLNLTPFELGLGYAFSYNHLQFRLLIEHSPLFGQSPYTSIRWDL